MRAEMRLVALVLFLCGVATTSAVAQVEGFDLEETVMLCASCHGEHGIPEDREIPIIWGQEFYYIYVQLKDYKAGRRANEIMNGMAVEFDKDQMKQLSQYFSEKQWPEVEDDSDDGLADRGEGSLAAGQCSQCHSTYHGDSRVPRLAGQYREYLERTMLEFKEDVRLNSPAKGSLMGSFSDEQIAEMAHHLAGL